MSPDPCLVFVHGWGFDAGVWTRLCEHLPDVASVTVDLGFRGEPRPLPSPPPENAIAVGHSLGFLWLLQERPFVWRQLVAINGFAKFAAADDFPSGHEARMLNAMIGQCRKDPQKVVAEFFKTCGHDERPRALNREILAQGLARLRDGDLRDALKSESAPLLALAGEADPIASRAMTEASFANRGNTQLHWHEGGHLLPLSAPAWCAERIREFIGRP